MNPNRLKQQLAAGRVPLGHMIFEFGTRGIAQMLSVAGLDFVVVDTEHSGFGPADIADLMAWFRATPVTPFVRIPQIDYHFIARTLDAGAMGIMVPNVKTAAEARAVVAAAKYAPLGRRGVFMGGVHTGFESVQPVEFMAAANENTAIICQIESQEGLDNLAAIAGTPGVDVLWVGHFDLSQSLGIPGQFDHPQFLAGLKLVVETARAHGLGVGGQPGSLEQARGWLELGFNVISYGGDSGIYLGALKTGVAGLRELTGQ